MKRRTPRKRAYDSTGRREEAQRTTARIVEAASELLQTVRPESLSYADVAERSQTALRTVYRHFPEPRDLLAAVAQAAIARFAPEGLPPTRPETVPVLAAYHQMLSDQPSLYRVVVAAPVRSQVEYGDQIRRLFGDALEGLSPEQQRPVAALLELLLSPYAWEVLHTHWSLPAEQITRSCLAATQLLADGFRREPRLLDPSSPLPALYRPKPAAQAKKRKEEP